MREISCPHCGARLQIAADLAHRPAQCPVCKQDVATPHATEAITADVPAALPGQPTGITTPDQVLPHYPDERGGKQTLSARLGNWRGCITALVLAMVFGLAVMIFVVPPCQLIYQTEIRTRTMSHMKQIGLACHTYYDTHGTFPTPKMIVADDGKTVELSWRVSILPFLEEQARFAEFDRTTAWDSPANSPHAQSIPPLYEDALRGIANAPTPATFFQYFTGPSTLWPTNAPVQLKDITDGSSFTILFAEGGIAVPWTKAADMVVAPDRPLPLPEVAHGNKRVGFFCVCLVDGSVRNISSQLPEATIRLLIDPRDGRNVPEF